MTNLLNYLTIGKRLGESVNLPYNGDSYVSTMDGSVWKAANAKVLPYTSAYAELLTQAPYLITAATQELNGPFLGGFWQSFVPKIIVGATTGGAVWLMTRGSSSFYYTSTDAGVTWTMRNAPLTDKVWAILWDGTNFVLYAQSTGATGVQESTDGITWTARTAISLPVNDLVYNGSVYLAWPNSGTICATSPDRTTWTTRTCNAAPNPTAQQAIGVVTWNAGASLFIAGCSTAGSKYQTSPDGVTWTLRTGLEAYPGIVASSLYASNATTTVVLGAGVACATTTNGINWTERVIDTNLVPGNASIASLFWDGTNFVANYLTSGFTYYSSDGITWTRATRAVSCISGSFIKTPLGVAVIPTNSQLALHQTDVDSVANVNIVSPATANSYDIVLRPYIRIL